MSEQIKLELKNSRYPDRELKERILEVLLYARYAGLDLEPMRAVILNSTLENGNQGPDMRYGGKLITEMDTNLFARFEKVICLYPVFNSWDIRSAKDSKIVIKPVRLAGSPAIAVNIKKNDKAKETVVTSKLEKTTENDETSNKMKEVKKMPTAKKAATSKAKSSMAKKTVVKKAVAKKSAPKKAIAKKAASKKVAVKKTAVKKTTAKKSAAKKSTSKKVAVKKSAAKKSTSKKVAVKKTAVKKTTAKKSAAKKSAKKK